MKKYTPSALLILPCALLVSITGQAATLSEVNHWILASENDVSADYSFNISVNSSNSGFSGSVDKSVNESFSGSVEAYRFFNQSSVGVIGSYTSSGSRIATPTPTSPASTGGQNSNLKLWTTTNPDSVAGAPVDYATTPDFGSNTMVHTYAANGTIDVSGLASGTIYMFYGAYRNTPQFDFTMTGIGQTNIELLDAGDNDTANNNEFYAYAFSFDTSDGLYDTISYNFSIPEANNGRGRLGGIVISGVTAIPEPSLATLGGLSILALLRRRR